MGKNEFELEDDFLKSIEKMVEEETYVAKASVGSADKYNIPRDSVVRTTVSSSSNGMDKTRMIDVRNIEEKIVESGTGSDEEEDCLDDILTDDYELEDEELLLDAPFQRKSVNTREAANTSVKRERQGAYSDAERSRSVNGKAGSQTVRTDTRNGRFGYNYKLIIGAAVLVVAVIVIIIVVAVSSGNKKKESYQYNYDTGIEYYNSMDYVNAKAYLEKAYGASEGKKNTELMFALYECYIKDNNAGKAMEMLDAVLSYDNQNEKALKAKSECYFNNKDGAALTELLKKYRGNAAYAHISQYDVEKPSAPQKETNFNNKFELELTAPQGCSIYYTTDGSEPTSESTLYDAKIVVAGEDNIIKAVAVNDIGVISEVAEFSYKINYLNPEGPVYDIQKSEVEIGTKLLITNIPDNAKAYYTLDGTTPSAEATLYTDGIVLDKEGNIVVSAIIISEQNKSSQIVRRSYKVKQPKTYTFDEAKGFLTDRMQALNVLKSDGKTFTAGGTINIVYQARETVGDVELYYVRVDSTTNGATTVYGYYGIGIRDGRCYKVTGNSGSYKAVEY